MSFLTYKIMWLLCFLLVINICRANEEQCNCDALVNKVINFQTNQLSELEIYKQKTNLLWERQENFIATLKDQNTENDRIGNAINGLKSRIEVHTDNLAALVSYQRKTDKLIEWYKSFNINLEEEKRVNEKLDEIEKSIADLRNQTKKIEDQLIELQNTSQKLNNWIDESDTKIAETVQVILQFAINSTQIQPTRLQQSIRDGAQPQGTQPRSYLRRTPEQTIFEQMKLVLANLTTEMASLRKKRLPDLESKVAMLEALLSGDRELTGL